MDNSGADSVTSGGGGGPSDVDDDSYALLSRLDAVLDVLTAMDVLEDLQRDRAPPRRRRRRRQASHVYSVRQYILKCCSQGFCDSGDFC